MNGTLRIYIPGTSAVHRADARVKLVLLLALSVSVFFIETWTGLGLAALVVLAAVACARLPLRRLCVLSVPVLIVLGIIWVCNAFALDVGSAVATAPSATSAGFAAGWQPIALWGTFGFVPEGCMRGLFYTARIMIILFASFVVTFATPAEGLMAALASLMAPLRLVRVPVDDVALMLSLALRFIPLMAEELDQLRRAQVSRGADFAQRGLFARVASWQTVLIPLAVRMFRRAVLLGEAMEARCYGAGTRTRLAEAAWAPLQVAGLIAGLACCVALCVFL